MIKKMFSKIFPKKFKLAYKLAYMRRATNRNIEKLLCSKKNIYLELGAGPRKGENGWVTSDICGGTDLIINLLERFPFPDNTIDKIYASHVLEHFSVHQLEFILSECRRVLKLSGIFSVCVPNAAIYIKAYDDPVSFDPDIFCKYKPAYIYYSKIDYVNYMAYMGGHHQHMFDEENLIQMLRSNGFQKVKSRQFEPDLDIQTRDRVSLYAQGEK